MVIKIKNEEIKMLNLDYTVSENVDDLPEYLNACFNDV